MSEALFALGGLSFATEEVIKKDRDAIMIDVEGMKLGCGFDFGVGVAHGDTVMHRGQHFQVIATVAKGHRARHGLVKPLTDPQNRGGFVDAVAGNFDVVRR